MRAGDLDRQIVIQQATPTQNAYGEIEESWATLATVWAAKRDLHGRELFQAQQVHAEVDTAFRIRYRSDIAVDVKKRVSYAGKLYDIQAVLEVGRREEMKLLTTAVVP